jgi:Ser/Thr protein kinase RdoA (MazF antagonist)
MSYAVDSYFQKMSEIGNKLSVVCHSDFTQGNVMVEEGADENAGGRRRVGFIDW